MGKFSWFIANSKIDVYADEGLVTKIIVNRSNISILIFFFVTFNSRIFFSIICLLTYAVAFPINGSAFLGYLPDLMLVLWCITISCLKPL
jgi:hypothetical protein